MRPAWLLGLGVLLTVAMVAPRARGEEVDGFPSPDDEFWSERSYCALSRTSMFRFQELPAGEAAPPVSPTLTLGPFDETIYCFRTVEIFAFDSVPEPEEGGWRSHLLEVTIHLAGPDHERWWKLVDVHGKRPWSQVLDSDAPALSDVRWALPRAHEPVFEVTIRSDYAGMGQRSQERTHLLIDLRSATPEIMGSYVMGGAEYGGMPCTWNAAMQENAQFSCTWDPPFGDFRCTSSADYKLPWIRYTCRTCFHLKSGVEFRCADLPPLPLISPAEALSRAAGRPDSAAGQLVAVETGVATILAMIAQHPREPRAIILGSASDGVQFDPSFLILTPGSDGQPQLRELELSYVDVQHEGGGPWSSGYEDWHAHPATPPELRLVSTALLSDRDSFRLVRLVVEQGTARALVLVAVDSSGAAQRAEAIVVATEVALRGACGDPLYPATAVSYDAPPGGLPARLAVEPAFQTAGIHGPSRYGYPQVMTLRWDHDKGFILEKVSQDFRDSAPVRRVNIADDGSLSFTSEPAPE